MHSFFDIRPIWISRLTSITLAYLGLPNLLFLLFWLRKPFNLLAGGLLFVVLAAVLLRAFQPTSLISSQSIGSKAGAEANAINTKTEFWFQVGLTFLPLTLVLLVSGIGGFGYQSSDWPKHNAILRDLMVYQWPVQYSDMGGDNLNLIYYFAYYLPAAAVGKNLGWDAANNALLLWSNAGFFLLSTWITLLLGKKVWWVGIAFVSLGSYELIGHNIDSLVTLIRIKYSLGIHGEYLGYLQRNWQWEFIPSIGVWVYPATGLKLDFTTVLGNIFFVPQHTLPAWLTCCLVLRNVPFFAGIQLESRTCGPMETAVDFLVLALLPLWSAFVAIGYLPYVLLKRYRRSTDLHSIGASKAGNDNPDRNGLTRWMIFSTYSTVLIICCVVVLFFSEKQSAGRFGFQLPLLQFLSGNVLLHVVNYVFTITLQWVVPVGLILFSFKAFPEATAPSKPYFYLSLVILVLLPCFNYGLNNDLVMRSNMLAIFIIRLLLLHFCILVFSSKPSTLTTKSHRLVATLVSVMCVCSLLMEGNHMKQTLNQWQTRPSLEDVPPITKLFDSEQEALKAALSTQYLGQLNPHFFRKQ